MGKLEELKGNAAVLTLHARAIDILKQIGFFEFLEEKARPHILGLGDNPQILATQAARSVGYFEAIEDIVHFKERYYKDSLDSDTKPFPDYGGLTESIKKGYLTEEEANELRKQLTLSN